MWVVIEKEKREQGVKNTKKKIIFRFHRWKKSLFSSRLKQREKVDHNVPFSNKELSTLIWRLFSPYFVDNILQFYHETYISYILDDFRQYCPRIEENIVYFCARQYCPLSKQTYFLGSMSFRYFLLFLYVFRFVLPYIPRGKNSTTEIEVIVELRFQQIKWQNFTSLSCTVLVYCRRFYNSIRPFGGRKLLYFFKHKLHLNSTTCEV